MRNKVPPYLSETVHVNPDMINVKRAKLTFLDKTLLNSASVIKSIYLQAENAAEDNLIRKINPYAKLISLIYFAVVISLIRTPVEQVLITTFVILLYIIARLNIFQIYRKIFVVAFLFGFLAVLPASLNVITKGKIILNIITFDRPSHFWIYNIPENIGITENGLQVVLLVFLRVLNSVSFALLIVFTTPFSSFIKSLKIVGVPETFMMIIALAYKYIFILSRTIEETYFALKSRLAGNVDNRNIRNLIGGRLFFIFRKSRIIYESTYFAMVSRGYSGKAKLNVRYPFTSVDLVYLIIIVSAGIVIIIL